MLDREELCKKITEIYPEIGECGIDIDVTLDEAKDRKSTRLKSSHVAISRMPSSP